MHICLNTFPAMLNQFLVQNRIFKTTFFVFPAKDTLFLLATPWGVNRVIS
jgi:hypothetical protein